MPPMVASFAGSFPQSWEGGGGLPRANAVAVRVGRSGTFYAALVRVSVGATCPASVREEEAIMTHSHLTSQRAALETCERRCAQLAPRRVLAALLALTQATSVFAAGVVGTGTPDSCTEAALGG